MRGRAAADRRPVAARLLALDAVTGKDGIEDRNIAVGETGIGQQHALESASKEPGHDDQQATGGHLRAYQERTQAGPVQRTRGLLVAVFHGRVEIAAAHAPQRREADRGQGKQGDSEGCSQGAQIRRVVEKCGESRGRADDPRNGVSNRQTTSRTEGREYQAFGKQVEQDAGAACTERGADAKFAKPAERAAKREVGQVRAGHKENQAGEPEGQAGCQAAFAAIVLALKTHGAG